MKSIWCLAIIAVFSLLFIYSPAMAQNRVVVIPLVSDDGPTCSGVLHENRWCNNYDGTVTDLTTGLVWLQIATWGGDKPWRNSSTDCDPPDYTCYDDAHTRAGLLQDGTAGAGLSDGSVRGEWRLPTREELNHAFSGTDNAYGSGAFLGLQLLYYWTSTSSISLSYAIQIAPGPTLATTSKTNLRQVWPVRDGNN